MSLLTERPGHLICSKSSATISYTMACPTRTFVMRVPVLLRLLAFPVIGGIRPHLETPSSWCCPNK
jgi:hypothetical protein